MNQYEQSALVFYSEKNFLMSYNLFLDALSTDKENSMFWYGLGDSLCGYANQKGVKKLYSFGIACIKTSLEKNPENQYSSKMLERMRANPLLGDGIINQINSITLNDAQKLRIALPTEKLIENYQNLKSVDNKIKAIMHLGETQDSKIGPLLQYLILNETNQSIRFAALKRIPLYQDSMNLKPMFDEMLANDKVEENEPYFSLAAGGIKQEWAQKISNEFKNKQNNNDELNKAKLNTLYQDEMLYMNLSLLLMQGEELKSMIQNNQRKEIGDKISLFMKPNVIQELKQKEVMNGDGSFSNLGIALLTKYLNDSPTNTTSNSPKPQSKVNSEKHNESHKGKKWWKIW